MILTTLSCTQLRWFLLVRSWQLHRIFNEDASRTKLFYETMKNLMLTIATTWHLFISTTCFLTTHVVLFTCTLICCLQFLIMNWRLHEIQSFSIAYCLFSLWALSEHFLIYWLLSSNVKINECEVAYWRWRQNNAASTHIHLLMGHLNGNKSSLKFKDVLYFKLSLLTLIVKDVLPAFW